MKTQTQTNQPTNEKIQTNMPRNNLQKNLSTIKLKKVTNNPLLPNHQPPNPNTTLTQTLFIKHTQPQHHAHPNPIHKTHPTNFKLTNIILDSDEGSEERTDKREHDEGESEEQSDNNSSDDC